MRKRYSVRKGRSGHEYALGDVREPGNPNWRPERRALRGAVHKSVESGHVAVGHARDLYLGQRAKKGDRRQ